MLYFWTMRKLLWPFSLVYGGIVSIRNWAFDQHLLKQRSFEVPVISIGNLSAGGTGKSPLVQYLAEALSHQYKVAILSRGYGRTTKGYRQVTMEDTARQSGDEPLQYIHSLNAITVAVCEDRVEGIRRLLKTKPGLDVILLDDAYQHRYVKAGFAILLTDFKHPYYADLLLPAGNLREPVSGAVRADVIVVTKCPMGLSADERQVIKDKLNPLPHQSVYFSYVHYRNPMHLLSGAEVKLESLSGAHVMLVCGIANPSPLIEFVSSKVAGFEKMLFSDHHHFSVGDVLKMKAQFEVFSKKADGKTFLLTTRKDLMRLMSLELQHLLKTMPLLILDIEPLFYEGEEDPLLKKVETYIRTSN